MHCPVTVRTDSPLRVGCVTGTTVAPERVHTDEISECSAECAAEAGVMFGGSNAVEVDFHIIVPEGLQDTTASLVVILKESETQLEVAVEGTVVAASTAFLMPPVTRSAPAPVEATEFSTSFDSTCIKFGKFPDRIPFECSLASPRSA